MTGPNRGSPLYRVLFANPETTFGTDPDGYPVAADALRIIGATVSVKAPTQRRVDAFGTATQNGSIDLKRTVEWSCETYLYTPGTAATVPDFADLLVSCGLLQQTAAVADTAVSGGTATTTVIPVTEGTGSNFTAGVSCVTISGETRRILSINTAPNPDTITLATPLSSAPASGVTVTSGITYRPHDGADSTPTGSTLWIGNNNQLWRLTGAVATSFSISGGGDGAIRMTMSGLARDARQLLTGTLAASIADGSVTSATVASDKIVPSDVSASIPYYFVIDRGETAEEIVKVTALAGSDVLTIVRGQLGSSGVAHSNGATIEPYQPTGTYSGAPIPATGGSCFIASTLTQIETFSVEVDTGLIPREDEHGAEFKMADYIQGLRSVTATAECWTINSPHMLRVREAFDQGNVSFFCQQGDTTGSIVAVECPIVHQEVPDFSFDDGEVRLTLSGQASGTVEDEIFLMIG